MSVYLDPPTPSPSPPPSRGLSLWKKPPQDVTNNSRSSSLPPSMFLNIPQASAGNLLTPPETPVKNQHATNTTSSTPIDCHVSKAGFLLAQASLATELSGRSSMTEFKFRSPGSAGSETQTLQFGTGLDGCFNRTRGFLGGRKTHQNYVTTRRDLSTLLTQRLPPSLEAWEKVHGDLPRLLRAGRVQQAVDALGEHAAGERDAWDDLERCHLARAALVLSALAHAYRFGEEEGMSKEGDGRPLLPRHVLDAWKRVCTELGRPLTGRVPADDILNNAMGNGSFGLSSAYFDLPEERLSSGLQGTMEVAFAPALSAMTRAQSCVLADQPDQVAQCLESLAARIVKCAHVFESMTPRDTKHFDPVVWIKTYAAMGRAVAPGELGNSGADTPLFHAMDAFIGRETVKGDLGGMQSDRKAMLPANIRAFLDVLGHGPESVKEYVAAARAQQHHLPPGERSQYQRLLAAWDGLLQLYVWFLERHRVKAVGVTCVSLNTGRHSTSSGVKSGDQAKAAAAKKPKMGPEIMLSMQMKKGMVSRLGGRPLWQDAHVQSRTVYQGTVVVAVRLDATLPLEPGDRVQVWPPRKRKTKRSSPHYRRMRALTPTEDDDSSSSEESDNDSDDDDADGAEPRFYSIARAIPDAADGTTDSRRRGGMIITLTVGQHSPEGLVSSFLNSAAQGTHLRLRLWPSPRFRQPRDMTLPLVLIGQGSGAGPLVGFLHDRAAWAQQRNGGQDEIGEMLLVVGAKTRRHVPFPHDCLEQLTRTLPLTIILALSQEAHLMIRDGTVTQLPQGGRRVTRHLTEHRDYIQRLVKEKGAHVFVCGSSDFGISVANSVGLGQSQKQQQQQQRDESHDDNRTQIPSPPAYWNQLHQEFYSMVKRPSASRSSSCASSSSCRSKGPRNTIISRSELAAHNSITSCWIAIGGTVYDMTPFLSVHPGGPKTLLESAGTIADARFAETHGGPHAQEIRSYLRSHAIGRLATDATISDTQMTAAKITDALVRMQNALTNNSAFDASRGPIPVYVYEDALLVFADGLDGVLASLPDDDASDDYSSELRETIENTQALLKKSFADLKERCKRDLSAIGSEVSDSSSTVLEENETLIQGLYMEPIKKLHAAMDTCKKDIREIEMDSSDGMCDAHDDENADTLKRVLEKFCTSLASVVSH